MTEEEEDGKRHERGQQTKRGFYGSFPFTTNPEENIAVPSLTMSEETALTVSWPPLVYSSLFDKNLSREPA